MYSSDKRKKELARKKKQDEKRTKRNKDSMESSVTPEGTDAIVDDSVSSNEIPETPSDST
jgi:hypothetical protein